MFSGMASTRNTVAVPAVILRAIRRAQTAPGVDEYSLEEVRLSAIRLGETEALNWIDNHPISYLHGVYNGFAEET